MSIEKRGQSYRAKVWGPGKSLVAQQTFPSRAEAAAWEKTEKAKLTLAPLPQKSISDFIGMQSARSLAALREFDLRQAGFIHVSELPAQEPTSLPHKEVRTLGEVAARYRDAVTVRKKGREQETFKINAILTHTITRKRLSDLTKRDFQSYRDERLGRVGPSTVKKELNLLHAVIQHAREEWGLDLKENPASVRHAKVANARDRRLVDDEGSRLLAAADPLMADAIAIAIDTGMRQGEILKLRPTMLRAGGYLALPGNITKSGKARDVPLTERTAGILAARTAGNGLCFPVVSANAFRMAFIRTTKRAKIVGLTYHDLRHEAVSRLFESGKYQQAEIMQIAGHESDAMVRRYLKTSGKELASRRRA